MLNIASNMGRLMRKKLMSLSRWTGPRVNAKRIFSPGRFKNMKIPAKVIGKVSLSKQYRALISRLADLTGKKSMGSVLKIKLPFKVLNYEGKKTDTLTVYHPKDIKVGQMVSLGIDYVDSIFDKGLRVLHGYRVVSK
jgi:hypothetical protein